MSDTPAVKLTARDEFAIAAFHALMTSEKVKAKSPPSGAEDLGSNFWPDLCLECAGKDVDGEMIDALARNGFLTVYPAENPKVVRGDEDIPDIECRWEYLLTDLGRAALASERKP